MSNADTTTNARTFKARELFEWVINRPDENFTIEMAARAVGWSRSSTGNALRKMIETYPESLESRSQGVYKWHSKPMPKQLLTGTYGRGDNLLVEVVTAKDDGTLLVTDDSTGTLYSMRKVEF